MRSAAFVPAALLGGACTQLGPMPATTGITAMPVGRTALQAQVGVVPGFYGSQSAQNEAKGAPIKHASLLLEPGRALGVPGLPVAEAMARGTPAIVADATGQTEQVLAGIDALLARAGTDKSKLLKANIWLADMADFAKYNELYKSYFPNGAYPTRSTVAGNWRPG